jgi:hypothetical protein
LSPDGLNNEPTSLIPTALLIPRSRGETGVKLVLMFYVNLCLCSHEGLAVLETCPKFPIKVRAWRSDEPSDTQLRGKKVKPMQEETYRISNKAEITTKLRSEAEINFSDNNYLQKLRHKQSFDDR